MLMNSYETVNDILVKLFNEIMDVEERALITSEYKDISVNDMHVIEAIGIREPKNMSTVARAVSVTGGNFDDRDQSPGQEGICRAQPKRGGPQGCTGISF